MDLQKLYSMQRMLDERIETQHGLQDENLVEKKMLALLVEIGELANETRCFKFWSLKPPASLEKVLEEYVDGLHFILSLGLEFNFVYTVGKIKKKTEDDSLVGQFLRVFQAVTEFQQTKSLEAYERLFTNYLQLGEHLGFTNEQIEQAYMKKNEVNHERQNQNY
ncbi:dimeric dUTPase (all-alpha-NTP-PPase superfamily) [Anoxybacillus vitaminiphilus]|uniref:Dimeric dUTPase (All-alpha-NTP-PPase superfamily) n=1 Tax=Paranoxybacillus vitaminiphilus TaxID=581036 RepID=A0A327YM57_9BACL|nr:dUTP diphosphatase [Anoxybacillus vitaminiphilus]RAK21286.1 dimeric dUTPase (all-alpha-NTP-PPase superfamily) [Anoxybacillus vitaminiphilus]